MAVEPGQADMCQIPPEPRRRFGFANADFHVSHDINDPRQAS
jgi:hypothetical protein